MDYIKKRFTHLKNSKNFYPKNIMDLGAHNGQWSCMIQNIFPNANIFMVEANPNKNDILKSTNIPFTIKLLGDHLNKFEDYYMTTDNDDSGNSIYRQRTKKFMTGKFNVKRLPMSTLDFLISDNNIDKIDLINFDLEGSEIDVINGSKETIRYCRYISINTQLLEYNLNAPLLTDIVLYLDKLNFRLYDIVNLEYLENNKLKKMQMIFENKTTLIDKIWDDELTTIDFLNSLQVNIDEL